MCIARTSVKCFENSNRPAEQRSKASKIEDRQGRQRPKDREENNSSDYTKVKQIRRVFLLFRRDVKMSTRVRLNKGSLCARYADATCLCAGNDCREKGIRYDHFVLLGSERSFKGIAPGASLLRFTLYRLPPGLLENTSKCRPHKSLSPRPQG